MYDDERLERDYDPTDEEDKKEALERYYDDLLREDMKREKLYRTKRDDTGY